MEIYLKYNAESEKYAHLVADALQKSGHGVFTRKHFSSDAKAMQECHICLDMTTGKLAETTVLTPDKPAAPKGLKKNVDDRVGKLVLVIGKKSFPRRQLLPLTGYIRGGCCPIGMKRPFPSYIDETCLLHEKIYVSAGQRGMQLRLAPQDLIKYVPLEVSDLI